MFSSSKIFTVYVAVVAFSSGVYAEKEVAETFGLLGGLLGGHGVGGNIGVIPPVYGGYYGVGAVPSYPGYNNVGLGYGVGAVSPGVIGANGAGNGFSSGASYVSVPGVVTGNGVGNGYSSGAGYVGVPGVVTGNGVGNVYPAGGSTGATSSASRGATSSASASAAASASTNSGDGGAMYRNLRSAA